MTNDEKRILRNTTRSIERTVDLAVELAMSAVDAYGGTEAAVLYEQLYLSLREVKKLPQLDALKAAGIPSNFK